MVTKSTGSITTVAGTGMSGFSGDGWRTTSAELKTPQSVAVDASGNIYIAVGNRILIVAKSTAIIMSLAGDVSSAFIGVKDRQL
jgi:trimeric autotransporter adhesin